LAGYAFIQLKFIQPFMLPIILGVAAVGTAAIGVKKGSQGLSDRQRAESIAKTAQAQHKTAVLQFNLARKDACQLAEIYGKLQLRVQKRVLGRLVDFIERIGRQANQKDKRYLKELYVALDLSAQRIDEYKSLAIRADEHLKNGMSLATTGIAAGSGAASLASSIGTTTVTRFFGLWTTEVSISQLTGAAARSATLAWLGGGSATVGGFVLGGVTLGPALLVGGLQLAGQGEKALTQANQYKAEANIKATKILACRNFLRRIEKRTKELGKIVHRLERDAIQSLNKLEAQPFDSSCDEHTKNFQQAALLATAIREIITVPILDDQGNLNPKTLTVKEKYETFTVN